MRLWNFPKKLAPRWQTRCLDSLEAEIDPDAEPLWREELERRSMTVQSSCCHGTKFSEVSNPRYILLETALALRFLTDEAARILLHRLDTRSLSRGISGDSAIQVQFD
jgi:hypothetical protein